MNEWMIVKQRIRTHTKLIFLRILLAVANFTGWVAQVGMVCCGIPQQESLMKSWLEPLLLKLSQGISHYEWIKQTWFNNEVCRSLLVVGSIMNTLKYALMNSWTEYMIWKIAFTLVGLQIRITFMKFCINCSIFYYNTLYIINKSRKKHKVDKNGGFLWFLDPHKRMLKNIIAYMIMFILINTKVWHFCHFLHVILHCIRVV